MVRALRLHWPEYLMEATADRVLRRRAGGAPPLGMLLAAQAYTAIRSACAVHCAKLHHENDKRCIFCQAAPAQGPA